MPMWSGQVLGPKLFLEPGLLLFYHQRRLDHYQLSQLHLTKKKFDKKKFEFSRILTSLDGGSSAFWLQTSFLLISVLVLVFVYGPASVIGRIFSDPNLPSFVPSYDPQPYSIHRHRFEAKRDFSMDATKVMSL